MSEKVVLAYSGGLDTAVILKWLINKGYDVIAYVADVGQKEDFETIRKSALAVGAAKIYIEDLKREFITDFIIPTVRANATYEGKYLLGTSVARPLIAKKQIEIANKENCNTVAHGATGKGNDQVRFELTYAAMKPDIQIISPWKDKDFLSEFEGRDDLIKFSKQHEIPVKATVKEPWSSDPNLMHTSYEAGELENPNMKPRESMFEMTVSPQRAPDKETDLEIEFKDGRPTKVSYVDIIKEDPLELYIALNDIGGKNGVGRVDMVENRYVGLKSRGVYESPAATILYIAHRDLEGITMDREVMHLRDLLMPKYAELIYYGYWYSPEMEFLRRAFDKSQENVTGKVRLQVYKGNIMITGRESSFSLYDEGLASMHHKGDYNHQDAKGFININALRLKQYARRKKSLSSK